MENFVTLSDFKGFTEIAETDAADEALIALFSDSQKAILLDLLGYTLYNDFDAGLTDSEPLQKWVDLRDGANFVSKGITGEEITLRWGGLRNMLIGFVYYDYVKHRATSETGVGVAATNVATATKATVIPIKVLSEFNKSVFLYGNEIVEYHELPRTKAYRNLDRLITIDQYRYVEMYQKSLMIPSAFNFIYRNSLNYPFWWFKQKYELNSFGI